MAVGKGTGFSSFDATLRNGNRSRYHQELQSIVSFLPPRVAIIGANGFVGSRVVEIFHLAGVCEVRPIVRQVTSLARLSRFDLSWRLADATRSDDLAQALAGCDAVVDCTVGLPKNIEAGAKALIPAARRAGVKRVVYLSSASVHGQNPPPGSDEDSRLSVRQEMAYNNAKVKAERCLLRDSQRLGIELFMLRPSIVFGPRDRWASSLVNELEQGLAWLVNEGKGICNTIYVDNLVEAIRCCLVAPAGSSGRPYHVGDAEVVTWRGFYETTAHKWGLGANQIRHIGVPDRMASTWLDRLHSLRAVPLTQRAIALAPSRFKRIIKGAAAGWNEAKPTNPWALPDRSPVVMPGREMVLLQQCCHRFPQEWAFKQLGYQPIVSFDEGLDRTLAWIKWARS